MTVITNIQTIETTDEEYYHMYNQNLQHGVRSVFFTDKETLEPIELTREIIRGKRVFFDGNEYVIGVSDEASKKLGNLIRVSECALQQLALADKTIIGLKIINHDYKTKIDEIEKASFYKRLIYLFNGKF